MAGTRCGGRKAAKTNIKRHGKDFYTRIGKKGGAAGHTGGFYSRPDLAKKAGQKGGKISSRAGVKNGESKTKPAPKNKGFFARVFGK